MTDESLLMHDPMHISLYYINVIVFCSGRGVWRCLYDPSSSLLVTAGFDSAIKLHQLLISSKGIEKTVASEDYCDKKEAFVLSIPKLSGHGGLMDRYISAYTRLHA